MIIILSFHDQAKALVEAALDKPFDQVFSSWDEKPLGRSPNGFLGHLP